MSRGSRGAGEAGGVGGVGGVKRKISVFFTTLMFMKKGAILLVSNNSVRRTQTQVLAKALAAIGRKYQHHMIAAGTATIIVMQSMPSYGWGLFDSAQVAMTCMFGGAGGITGGAAAAATSIKALPAVINATITVLLFVYFVASGLKVANGIGDGQEVTQMVQQPIGVFFVILVLWIAQSILFSGVTAAC